MTKKISDLSIDEFKDMMSDIIDQRIDAVLAPDGELREDFIIELLKRKNKADLVNIDEVWDK